MEVIYSSVMENLYSMKIIIIGIDMNIIIIDIDVNIYSNEYFI